MRYLTLLVLCCAAMLAASTAHAQHSLRDLQNLLENAGYNVGGQDGRWGGNTRTALAKFIGDHGISVEPPQTAPDDLEIARIMNQVTRALEAAHEGYPTQPLPDAYYVGLASQWYFNIHNWGLNTTAIVNRNGSPREIRVERWFQPIEDDIAAYREAGVTVMRMQLGMEGTLFHEECLWSQDLDVRALDACYSRAFAAAKAGGWQKQYEELEDIASNPVVSRYIDAVDYWNRNGFHVMVVPSDFFTGNGSSFDGAAPSGHPVNPLVHEAVVNDRAFQEYFPQFVGALMGELRKRNLTNVSFQSLNETRFCTQSGRPIQNGLQRWRTLERALFDEVRRIAPRMSLVSTAICTAGDHYILSGRSYRDIGAVVPVHEGLSDVTYALHLYTPRALLIGTAQNAKYREGTIFHYPYQHIPASAALNDEARFYIEGHNKSKPGPAYFERMFSDIATFAASRSIRVMFTEVNAPKPDFGLPRADRVALIRDLVTFGEQYGVPLIHFGTLNQWGLSSCPHSIRVPDHRYDPGLMNIIAFGNGVLGADPHAELEPVEVQCGTQ
jgi:hypothetical protein